MAAIFSVKNIDFGQKDVNPNHDGTNTKRRTSSGRECPLARPSPAL